MSPLKEDGTGYRSRVLDESSWTHPDTPVTNSIDYLMVNNLSFPLDMILLTFSSYRQEHTNFLWSCRCDGKVCEPEVSIGDRVCCSPLAETYLLIMWLWLYERS